LSLRLELALDDLRVRAAGYQQFVDYDHGFHPVMFSSPKFRKFYAEVLRRYRLNLCRPVIDAISERLTIAGWEGDAAQEWWYRHGLSLMNRVHRPALRAGDSYVLVWPDRDMNGPTDQYRANRLLPTEASVVYSEENDMPEFALKVWTEEVGKEKFVQRLNIYYYDRVERLVRGGTRIINYQWGGYAPYTDDEAGDIIEYGGLIRELGQDRLLPVVHFSASPDLTPYGTSMLEDVIPIQDALNKHAIDILVTSESVAMPLRALLGFEVLENADGTTNLPDYDPRVDYLLTVPGEAARLVQLDASNMEGLIQAKQEAITDVATVSGIHQSRLRDAGSVPSGEALRVVERPLVSQVRNLQQDFTEPWTDVARLLGVDGQPIWSDPVQMDVTETWALVQAKIDAGWPPRQAYVEAGLEPTEVDRILAENTQLVGDLRRNSDVSLLL
jgi:hypothetical protein